MATRAMHLAVEAAAHRVKEGGSKPCSQPLPVRLRTSTTWLIGIVRASSRRRRGCARASCGRRAGCRRPSTSAGRPHRRTAQLRELFGDAAGVGRGERGWSPSVVCRRRAGAPGERAPPARWRDCPGGQSGRRPPGTTTLRAASATGMLGSMALAAVFIALLLGGGRPGSGGQVQTSVRPLHGGRRFVGAMQATVVRRRRSGRYHWADRPRRQTAVLHVPCRAKPRRQQNRGVRRRQRRRRPGRWQRAPHSTAGCARRVAAFRPTPGSAIAKPQCSAHTKLRITARVANSASLQVMP